MATTKRIISKSNKYATTTFGNRVQLQQVVYLSENGKKKNGKTKYRSVTCHEPV